MTIDVVAVQLHRYRLRHCRLDRRARHSQSSCWSTLAAFSAAKQATKRNVRSITITMIDTHRFRVLSHRFDGRCRARCVGDGDGSAFRSQKVQRHSEMRKHARVVRLRHRVALWMKPKREKDNVAQKRQTDHEFVDKSKLSV